MKKIILFLLFILTAWYSLADDNVSEYTGLLFKDYNYFNFEGWALNPSFLDNYWIFTTRRYYPSDNVVRDGVWHRTYLKLDADWYVWDWAINWCDKYWNIHIWYNFWVVTYYQGNKYVLAFSFTNACSSVYYSWWYNWNNSTDWTQLSNFNFDSDSKPHLQIYYSWDNKYVDIQFQWWSNVWRFLVEFSGSVISMHASKYEGNAVWASINNWSVNYQSWQYIVSSKYNRFLFTLTGQYIGSFGKWPTQYLGATNLDPNSTFFASWQYLVFYDWYFDLNSQKFKALWTWEIFCINNGTEVDKITLPEEAIGYNSYKLSTDCTELTMYYFDYFTGWNSKTYDGKTRRNLYYHVKRVTYLLNWTKFDLEPITDASSNSSGDGSSSTSTVDNWKNWIVYFVASWVLDLPWGQYYPYYSWWILYYKSWDVIKTINWFYPLFNSDNSLWDYYFCYLTWWQFNVVCVYNTSNYSRNDYYEVPFIPSWYTLNWSWIVFYDFSGSNSYFAWHSDYSTGMGSIWWIQQTWDLIFWGLPNNSIVSFGCPVSWWDITNFLNFKIWWWSIFGFKVPEYKPLENFTCLWNLVIWSLTPWSVFNLWISFSWDNVINPSDWWKLNDYFWLWFWDVLLWLLIFKIWFNYLVKNYKQS